MIAQGCTTVCKRDVLSKVSESQILAHYFHIYEVPTLINSPLRKDDSASMGIYSPNGKDINYKDFGTGDKGSIFTLLYKIWNLKNYQDVFERILKEVTSDKDALIKTTRIVAQAHYKSHLSLDVKVREWRDYDLEWWGQYGITKNWLQKAEVYPISHIFRTQNNIRNIFNAEKLAYVYVERKEGKITKKIYQPLSKEHKWSQDNDKSVLGLWTLLPKTGKCVAVCSSVKDALTLLCNCGIPSICMQGEGYELSETVIKELKSRFETVLVMLDNDPPGIADAKKLCEQTGFTNIELPQFNGGKDIADYRKLYGHEKFVALINSLIN